MSELVDYITLASPAAEETRPMLISPFIRQGDTFLLTGDKGAGKSTITADFILALVAPEEVAGFGQAVAGIFKTDRHVWAGRKVLIMDTENDASEWREFVDASLEARGIRPGSDIYYQVYTSVYWENGRKYDWDNLTWLRKWVVEDFVPNLIRLGIGLVIIDSMHATWTRDLFKPDWVTGGVEHLRACLKDAGITLMCLTHTSRAHKDKLAQNEFSPYGTVRQDQACDTMIGIKRDVDNGTCILKLEKRRAGKWNKEKTKAVAKLSPTFGGYTRVLSNSWSHDEPKKGPVADLVLTAEEVGLLREAGDCEFGISQLSGNKRKNRLIIDSLVNVDILEFKGGAGVKGDPLRWQITNKGKLFMGTGQV